MGKEDYKNEKKGHGFLCVPKELLFDNRYKQLTIEAILLYAYMLDRLKLSIENGWKDSDGKVFIYFSLESIMDLLKCSKGKAISTLKELDEKHGIGLIEKKRSGYGKCSRIYVKEIFELSVSENEKTREKNEEDLEVTNKKHEKSKNKMSRSSKIEPIEVKKINPNNTNKSNTNKSNTKSNHIFRKDMEEKITIEQQIRTNIDYDSLLLTHREDVEQIDEIVNLISEILVRGDKRKIYIAGDMLDCEYVKERFRELNNKHIRLGKQNEDELMRYKGDKELMLSDNMQNSIERWKRAYGQVTEKEIKKLEMEKVLKKLLEDFFDIWDFRVLDTAFVREFLKHKNDDRYKRAMIVLIELIDKETKYFPELTKREANIWLIREIRDADEMIEINAYLGMLRNHLRRKEILCF